jgi:hypothetical protein
MTIGANGGSRWCLAESQRVGGGSLPNHGISAAPKAIPCGQTPPPTSTAKSLIANARLEFPATHRKQSSATNSNRERMGISCLSFSLFSGPTPQASSLRNLIVTPRLEFCAIKTKQTPSSISNRYKTRFSCPNISGAAGRPAVRTASSKEPAGCRHYKKRRPTEEKAKISSGRYVYDRGGADLSCGVAGSDYDVRSSRCTRLAPGVFWKGLSRFAPLWSNSAVALHGRFRGRFQLKVRGALICRVLWPSGWRSGWR